jgi:hypothetical protein
MKPLVVKPVPVPSKYKHPNAPHDTIPNHEFTMGLIAPKGAGKTTTICNLLNFYKGYFHTILVFSPTVESDEKWDWVKKQKLLVENKPLKAWIKQKIRDHKDDEDKIVQGPKIDPILEGLANSTEKFSEVIPEDCFYDDYNDEAFQSIMKEQMMMIRLLKKYDQPKYLANRILIIFDDLVGSSLFSGSRAAYFKGVNTRHRHYSASFIMVSQGYKEIPKTIRTNWTSLIVFEIGNEKEVEVIYEEFSMGLKRDDWMELFQHAVDGDHSFLYINFQKPKRLRMMKNFDQYLFIDK